MVRALGRVAKWCVGESDLRTDSLIGGNDMTDRSIPDAVSRRNVLMGGSALAGAAMLPVTMAMPVYAADKPAIGTYPAGSSGNSVFVGLTMPRTGTYAVQGEDELKGCQLAIEHINAGDPLIKAISPKTTK